MLVDKSPFNLERLQREVNILLISDLHYDVNKENNIDQWMTGKAVNHALVNSLKKEIKASKEWEPDIVVVAGDLVNQNRSKNYHLYNNLIEELTNTFPNLKNAYFSTPGNHDINRENMVSVFPYLYQLHQDPNFEILPSFTNNAFVDTIYTVAGEAMDTNPKLIEELGKFEKEYFKTYLANIKDLCNAGTIYPPVVDKIIDEIETVYYKSILGITLVSLNSSFFCNLSQTGQDRNNLFLIRGLVEKLKSKLEQIVNGPIISFMHHPYYYLHETEHIAPALNGKNDKQNNFTKLVKCSDLILSGHVHGEIHDPTFFQHYAHLITNGTSYTTDKLEDKCYPYTYALLKINKQLGKFSLKKFRYEKQNGNIREPYAFKWINRDTFRFYPFFERKGAEDTSVETEKVRVLYYFKSCKSIVTQDPELSFYIFQLRLYCNDLEDTSINYEKSERKLPGTEINVLEIKYQPNGIIWIFRMNEMDYLPEIVKILAGLRDQFPKGGTVYFSINMDFLVENGVLSQKKIENLRRTYQARVLVTKNEMTTINLLYH